ncbi:hypothetical protein M0812_30192 [Anaeramoeba flamelloides]|uniref:RGS domain-containing protein n=1 Tax=Anaeramoeba flamelloides TaxID=1746091 RepID=A0AAV7Y1B9_9EUKA|nr:hypothetical protein M0812_30192 [Anaeramoeba flamelloides]
MESLCYKKALPRLLRRGSFKIARKKKTQRRRSLKLGNKTQLQTQSKENILCDILKSKFVLLKTQRKHLKKRRSKETLKKKINRLEKKLLKHTLENQILRIEHDFLSKSIQTSQKGVATFSLESGSGVDTKPNSVANSKSEQNYSTNTKTSSNSSTSTSTSTNTNTSSETYSLSDFDLNPNINSNSDSISLSDRETKSKISRKGRSKTQEKINSKQGLHLQEKNKNTNPNQRDLNAVTRPNKKSIKLQRAIDKRQQEIKKLSKKVKILTTKYSPKKLNLVIDKKRTKLKQYTNDTNVYLKELNNFKEELKKVSDRNEEYFRSEGFTKIEKEFQELEQENEKSDRTIRKIKFQITNQGKRDKNRSYESVQLQRQILGKYKSTKLENKKLKFQLEELKQYLTLSQVESEVETEFDSNFSSLGESPVSSGFDTTDEENSEKRRFQRRLAKIGSTQNSNSATKNTLNKKHPMLISLSMDDINSTKVGNPRNQKIVILQQKAKKPFLKKLSPKFDHLNHNRRRKFNSHQRRKKGNHFQRVNVHRSNSISDLFSKPTKLRREKSLDALSANIKLPRDFFKSTDDKKPTQKIQKNNSDSTDRSSGNKGNTKKKNNKMKSSNSIDNIINLSQDKKPISSTFKKAPRIRRMTTNNFSTNNLHDIKKQIKEKKKERDITSLEMLLTIPIAVDYFKEFLCEELNQENILFFQDVKSFKQEFRSQKKMQQKAKKIYKKYIIPGSLFEINIISKDRKDIIEQIENKKFKSNMFDNAQETIFRHMNFNSWQPFVSSDIYQNLIKHLRNDSSVNLDPGKKSCELIYSKTNNNNNIDKVLNEENKMIYQSQKRNGYQVGEELLASLFDLLNTYFYVSTNNINMKAISASIPFRRFVERTGELKNVELDNLTRDERLCFFLNLFNMLTLHGFIVNGVPNDKVSVEKFMKKTKYCVNNIYFSLNDIYQGILRGNSHQKNSGNEYFKSMMDENKKKYAIEKIDPRIHFALINYMFPSFIRIYHLQNLNQILQQVTMKVLTPLIRFKNTKIFLPKLFGIYEKDFGKAELVITWLQNTLKTHFVIEQNKCYIVKFTHKKIIKPSIFFDLKRTLSRKFSLIELLDEK